MRALSSLAWPGAYWVEERCWAGLFLGATFFFLVGRLRLGGCLGLGSNGSREHRLGHLGKQGFTHDL